MTTPAITLLADHLDVAVTALGDVRGQDREELVLALGRIIETATNAIESIGKRKRRRGPATTRGFDTDNDWSDLIVRSE